MAHEVADADDVAAAGIVVVVVVVVVVLLDPPPPPPPPPNRYPVDDLPPGSERTREVDRVTK